MLLKRFYDEGLAQASYLVACQELGNALVVDPNRDVEQYLVAAAAEGVRITDVTETHIHADFVSGSLELARRTGARLHLSAEEAPGWKYAFAERERANRLRDGSRFDVGRVRIAVRHTPGHTPEHLTFLVTDTAAADHAVGAFTGDFVFVGDVGRPDLLERAAHEAGTMESGARDLYRSLQRLAGLPDHLQLWPGHGAGSACGKALGAMPQTTLGYERLVNWAFQVQSEDEFVAMVLAGQPEPPAYFGRMKRVNRDGPALLSELRLPEHLAATRLPALLDAGALVVDTRHAADFAAAHLPGTISIPLNRSFATWAGELLPYDRDLYLLVDDDVNGAPRCERALRVLSLIGLDRVSGCVGDDAMAGWSAEGRALEAIPQLEAREVQARLARGEVALVDVRGDAEWAAGHIAGAAHVPLGSLLARVSELPAGLPIVMQCQGGSRSAIGASLLRAAGRRDVANLTGGLTEWRRLGLPVAGTVP